MSLEKVVGIQPNPDSTDLENRGFIGLYIATANIPQGRYQVRESGLIIPQEKPTKDILSFNNENFKYTWTPDGVLWLPDSYLSAQSNHTEQPISIDKKQGSGRFKSYLAYAAGVAATISAMMHFAPDTQAQGHLEGHGPIPTITADQRSSQATTDYMDTTAPTFRDRCKTATLANDSLVQLGEGNIIDIEGVIITFNDQIEGQSVAINPQFRNRFLQGLASIQRVDENFYAFDTRIRLREGDIRANKNINDYEDITKIYDELRERYPLNKYDININKKYHIRYYLMSEDLSLKREDIRWPSASWGRTFGIYGADAGSLAIYIRKESNYPANTVEILFNHEAGTHAKGIPHNRVERDSFANDTTFGNGIPKSHTKSDVDKVCAAGNPDINYGPVPLLREGYKRTQMPLAIRFSSPNKR